MIRALPFALVWLVSIPFFIWLATAPKMADERFWQVDSVTVKMGGNQVSNPTDQSATPTEPGAEKKSDAPLLPPQTADKPMASLSDWPDDGVKIKPVSPDLTETGQGAHGPIPKIGADGTRPWRYYSRPFPIENTQPRLAIVLRDMGLSESNTGDAIRTLPGEITFAFSPYADNLGKMMQAARDRGHETLLQFPLEVQPGSRTDVGPRAYSTLQTPSVNQDNNFFMLAQMQGSIGMITDGGQRLVNNEAALKPLMQGLADRGLVFVDDTMQNETLSPLLAEQMKAPWTRSLMRIDDTLSLDAMDVAMGQAVALARQNGRALVVGQSSPLVRSVVANWAHRLEREGIALAPLSALVTEGSAAQPMVSTAPATAPVAPGMLTPRAEDSAEAPIPANPSEANSGPIDLLNPKGPGGAPPPNILDPGKTPLPAAPSVPSNAIVPPKAAAPAPAAAPPATHHP